MLAGVVLGAKRGTISVLLVLLIAAIGLPVLSGGRGGLAVFAAPTTGYLIGWVAAAFVTGFLCERLVTRQQSGLVQGVSFFIAALLGGVVMLYAFGISYLALVTGMGFSKAFLGSLAFIPGDVLKAAVAALAGRAVMAGYPLLPQRA
jgi:biotin transport system substrate-specific component